MKYYFNNKIKKKKIKNFIFLNFKKSNFFKKIFGLKDHFYFLFFIKKI